MATPFELKSAESPNPAVDVEKMREYWKKELMKLKCPLPPRQPEKSNLDMAIQFELIHGRKLDANMDIKTFRRTISNRISAQRSRMKRSQHITDMEKRVKDLEELVASLTPQIETHNEKKRTLQLENKSLRNLLDIRTAESKMSEEKLDEKRREIRELKEALIKDKDEVQVQVQVQVPDSSADASKPYSIEFYQERLMQLEMDQFISQELNNTGAEESMIHDEEEEEEEVDQYLNLEEEELMSGIH